MDADRRSFFFGTTLSEIGFILFFALLLFAFFQRSIDLKSIQEAKERAQVLAVQIAARESALAELEKVMAFKSDAERERFFNELVPRKELATENEELARENEELQSKLEMFDALQQQIDSAANSNESMKDQIEDALALKQALEESLVGQDDMSPEMLADALETQKVLEEFNESAPVPIDDPEALAEALEQAQRVGDLEGQVLNLRGRLGGRDLPPCWADRKTGKIEYLFDVIITDSGLQFSSAAPNYRSQEYADLPNTGRLTDGQISLGQFESLAKPILDISNSKQCRHYVAITDRSENAYKDTLTIEDYFYKFVNRT